MNILGISAFYHDSAAALVRDGEIVAAAQEERFTRKKHDSGFPQNAVSYCLSEAGLDFSQIDYVVFYDKPFLKFERLLETYLAFAPKGFSSFRLALPVWLKEKLFLKSLLKEELVKLGAPKDISKRFLFTEHHQSHAASAFFASPFERAAVLTIDGVGEWATTSLAIGDGNELKMVREIHFPHSLGLLYSAFTYYTGFKVNSGEYKVMGLAPYGKPEFTKLILEKLVDLKDDGSFRLDQSYFDYAVGLTMTNAKFHQLFGAPPRKPSEPLTDRHMNLAASVQEVCEIVMSRLARAIAKETGEKNLCLAGGVALNCVANGKILRENIFENIWIQPSAGDAGGALGAALAGYYTYLRQPRRVQPGKDAMKGAYLGPQFSQVEIEKALAGAGARFEVLSDDELISRTAKALSQEQAIGWFQGRMEFGPRALGGRSILGDARSAKMQRTLNLKVKYRESFRPFAPSILSERVSDWFEIETSSPYMLLVADVQKGIRREMSTDEQKLFGIEKLNTIRSSIPAVTHVDYSARIQTVHADTNPRYHQLLTEFNRLTGCPVIVNTSFNVRGEPIVGSPEDAFRCLMGTEIDVLAIGNCWVERSKQDQALVLDYKNAFELD